MHQAMQTIAFDSHCSAHLPAWCWVHCCLQYQLGVAVGAFRIALLPEGPLQDE
jgi:hypothetical protein